MPDPRTYSLRLMVRDDLAMIARWLSTPEVVEWWGDADEQFALISGDLDDPRMEQWIASRGDEAFAYLQAYSVKSWPQQNLASLPDDAKIVDAFVGNPAFLGRGHGRIILRRFAEDLIDRGAPLVAIDPDAGNHRARRAYAHAGFVGNDVIETGEGPTVVMIFAGRECTGGEAGAFVSNRDLRNAPTS